MTLYDLLEKRLGEAQSYIKEDGKVRAALRMIGKIKVNVTTTDTNEEVGAELKSDGIELFRKAVDGPAITLSGASKVLIELITKPSRAKFEEAEKKKLLKLESHGLKGKLVMSRVKDLLSRESKEESK